MYSVCSEEGLDVLLRKIISLGKGSPHLRVVRLRQRVGLVAVQILRPGSSRHLIGIKECPDRKGEILHESSDRKSKILVAANKVGAEEVSPDHTYLADIGDPKLVNRPCVDPWGAEDLRLIHTC